MVEPIIFLDGKVTQYLGDVRVVLKQLPADHYDCVVCSPPYWGLRDYQTGRWEGGDPDCDHRSPTMREGRNEERARLAGSASTNSAQLLLAHRSACGKCGAVKVDHQIGLEPTLAEHLAVMVDVFEEVKRVLKPAGTLWLNYGDCYATSPNGRSAADTKAAGNGGVLKPGDLCMIPNRLAIALQDAGWWVKAENIWGKTNPMPDSSGAIRPATAHEKIFMLTKSDVSPYYRARDTGEIANDPDTSEMVPMVTTGELGPRWIRMPFYFDAAAVRMGRTSDEDAATFRGGSYVGGQPGKRTVTGNKRIKMPDGWNTGPGGHGSRHPNGREAGKTIDKQCGHSRRHAGFNDRWDHMEREEQISNGRFLRNFEPAPLSVWPMATQSFSEAHFATFPPELAERCIKAGCPVGGHVLDIFGGAGTTALVAATLGRKATLIELNPQYAILARARIEAAFMGKEEGSRHMVKQLGKDKVPFEPGSLFAGIEGQEAAE